MKIIRLTTALDFGGIEKRLINISIHKDDNQWLFCALGKGGNAEEAIQKNRKRVFCFQMPYRIPSFSTIYKLVQFFKKEQPQVVHTSGAEANFHGVIAAKLARVPVIIAEEVGIPSQSSMAKIILKMVYTLSDYVVGNSKQVLHYLINENGVARTKLKQIPNPVIFPVLPQMPTKEDGKFHIISVSRLEKVKNIDSTLRVIARLNQLNVPVHYTIVGAGPEMSHLKNKTKELHIQNAVTFLGFQDNPYPFLLAADLYVLTSFSEGFSNSLAEAMYCGTPSLTTRVGAAEDLITDNESGWIVNKDDDEDLFQKIKYIIALPKENQRIIGAEGKAVVEANYSLQNHIDLLMVMYKCKV